MARYVEEIDIDYGEVLRHGGANSGDEDFFVFQCAMCGRIYLGDSEDDTVFLDLDDLKRRTRIDLDEPLTCVKCGAIIEAEAIWSACRGDRVAEPWRVVYEEMAAGPWVWVLKKSPQV